MAGELHYVDGVGRISVLNGAAHVDLFAIIPPAQGSDQPQMAVTHHLVMGLPQFVKMCADMGTHLRTLEEKGVITRQPNAQS